MEFPYDEGLIKTARSINARWSRTNKCWYVTNNPDNLKRIFRAFRGQAWVDKEEFFKQQRPTSGSPSPERKSKDNPNISGIARLLSSKS